MNYLMIRYGVIYFLLSALMVWRPWLSRKNVLFGVVFGDTEIWSENRARHTIKQFVLFSAAIAILVAVIFALIVHSTKMDVMAMSRFYGVAIFAFILLEMIPYIIANQSIKKLKASLLNKNLVKDKITVEIGGHKDTSPLSLSWFLLLLVPIVLTIILAIHYYPMMPERIATHFGAGGVADAWKTKSIGLVLGPVFNQILFSALIFLIGFFVRRAPSSVKGSPGAAPGYPYFRRILSIFIIGFAFVVEIQFIVIELVYAGIVHNIQASEYITIGLSTILAISLFIAFFRFARRREPTGAVLDDDSKWIFGMIYFNPSDSSLFVEKRHGIGQTINFGRPASWIFIVAIIVFIIIVQHLKS